MLGTMTGGYSEQKVSGEGRRWEGAQMGGAHNIGVEFSHIAQRMRDGG